MSNTALQLQHRAFLLWEQAKDHTNNMRYEAAADLRSEAFEMAFLADKGELNPKEIELNPPKHYAMASQIEKATRAVERRYMNPKNQQPGDR